MTTMIEEALLVFAGFLMGLFFGWIVLKRADKHAVVDAPVPTVNSTKIEHGTVIEQEGVLWHVM